MCSTVAPLLEVLVVVAPLQKGFNKMSLDQYLIIVQSSILCSSNEEICCSCE